MNRGKPKVKVYYYLNGSLNKTFESLTDASKELDIPTATLSKLLNDPQARIVITHSKQHEYFSTKADEEFKFISTEQCKENIASAVKGEKILLEDCRRHAAHLLDNVRDLQETNSSLIQKKRELEMKYSKVCADMEELHKKIDKFRGSFWKRLFNLFK